MFYGFNPKEGEFVGWIKIPYNWPDNRPDLRGQAKNWVIWIKIDGGAHT